MKKIKKIWTCVLAFAVFMTMIPVTALAEETSLIDDTKEVSLTIHKYEHNGTSQGNGTGNSGDKDKVPHDANPLEGVTFEVYKVANIVQKDGSIVYQTVDAIKKQYADKDEISAGLDFDGIKDFFTDKDMEDNDLKDKAFNIITKYLNEAKKTGKTDAEGIVKFSNGTLDGQGLYLVMETGAPDKVVEYIAPFLVSLPMTNVDDQGWLYDVHVFPKNSIVESGITLEKLGQTGNATETTPLKDAEFILQKQDEVTKEWKTQEKDADGIEFKEGTFRTNENGLITVSNLAPGSYRFIETKASDSTWIMDGAATYEFKINDEGNVTDVNGTEIVDKKITVMNYQPSVTKEVQNKAEDWKNAADYSVGEHVPFRVTATVPENIDKLRTYKLTDTMDKGLVMDDDDWNELKITYWDKDEKEITGVDDTKLSKEIIPADPAKNGTVWTLDYKDKDLLSELKAKNVAYIQVEFTAKLTEDAVTLGEGNHNEIALEYSNKIFADENDSDNPNKHEEGNPWEETTTITDKVVVVTFGMELTKTFDGAAPSEANLKAEFDLYRPIVLGETKDATLKLQNTATPAEVMKIGTYTTDGDGKIKINTDMIDVASDKAFSNGTYYFVETKTADGYNLLKYPVEVDMEVYYEPTFEKSTTYKQYDTDGKLLDDETNVVGQDNTDYYKDKDHKDKISTDDINAKMAVKVQIDNKKGFTLPVTGGMGTFLFSIIGIVLMAGGALILIRSKKKNYETN